MKTSPRFALFGAPIAHEDHPQRALYAALRRQADMRRYADRIRLERGMALQIRVGLNTGEVVVRSIRKDDLHTDYVPVGHSTHIAARMESVATPGSIVVSEHTQRLTEGYFEFKALGATQVKGVPEPLNVYEVVGLGPLRTRLQVAARRGLSRFVGRQSEMAHLHKALAQAKGGHGQIVGVRGEPGVGKSRLFEEGLALLAEALALVDKTGERYYEAELYRLKGELLLKIEDRRSKIEGRYPRSSILSPFLPRRSVFVRPSRLPAARVRSRWSCGR